ncbi:hypothetical protein MHBO_003290 [Bonamia ostreae]|uniref:Uncharacterized protein n=1 Tax=Bonamia ostreae TaxID=126728 RepID=A0ABV2AQE1_9EUKA
MKLLTNRFGEEFEANVITNEAYVEKRVKDWLSVNPPRRKRVISRLKSISEEYDLDIDLTKFEKEEEFEKEMEKLIDQNGADLSENSYDKNQKEFKRDLQNLSSTSDNKNGSANESSDSKKEFGNLEDRLNKLK